AAVMWLATRDRDPPRTPTPVVATPPPRPRVAVRRPPPPRPGAIDAPRASVSEDAEAAAGSLVGRVTSWLDASPVVGAELTWLGPGPMPGGGSLHTALTDDQGRFAFAAPSPGEYTLGSVLADGYQPYAPELGQAPLHYAARPGRRVDGVSISLMPITEVVGQVVDRGEPVVGARVRWLAVGTGESALAADDQDWQTDAAGEFRFDARLGAWLEASDAEHGVGRAVVDERTIAMGRLIIAVAADTPAATGEIAGAVFDPDGEPVEGARVLADAESMVPGAEAVTDADGAFVLFDLVPGPHRIEARAPPLAPVWAEGVPTGSDAVKLHLAAGGGVRGTLVSSDGLAVPGATVVALRHLGPMRRTQQALVTVFDAAGEFSLGGLQPGVYDIVGGAADHALARVGGVEVGAGIVEVSLVLPDGGSIAGRVVDAGSGKAVAQARVEVERGIAAGSSITPARSSALTDVDGAFVVRGVEPGRHSVYAYALGFAPRALSGIEVTAGVEAGPVEIALSPAEDATGEVFDFVGIGVMIRVEDEVLSISGLVPDGGAEAAGILPGDAVIAIDGIGVTGFVSLGEAVQSLRGREGTEVVLTVQRGEAEPFDVTVVRSRIRG
ncbi:MAG: carboxypeptidase regulatory-like domain-containing protein, partial [Deltaproteobacteria bacterium]|nr:carboxypeptidase regulatory-like domain-containing protein [Deltaproteobacteria bacterium]